jgi:hypothetical protein
MAIGHKLSLRLFLEGVEVPCIGASISVAPNSPAAASIQVIATNEIFNILPRTVVHLFFYDFVEGSNQAETGKKSSSRFSNIVLDPPAKKKGTPVSDTQENEPTKSDEQMLYEQYKVLFMGEVQGIQFAKDAGSRSVILSCVDFSNYWDTTYQYNFNGEIIGGRREAAFIGANANLFTSPLGHGEGTISGLLRGRSQNYPKLKGLLGGIVHVLEAIGGCYYTEKTFKGANPFCSIAELRLKLLQQICAAEDDTSTSNLFSEKTFAAWMNRSIGGLGKLVTFRGLIQVMEKFIYHEVYPVPSPLFIPEESVAKAKPVVINILEDPSSIVFAGQVGVVRKEAKSAVAALDKYIQATPLQQISSESDLGGEVQTTLYGLESAYTVLSKIKPPTKFAGVSAKVQVIGRLLKDADAQLGYGGAQWNVHLADVNRNRKARSDIDKIIDLCDEILGKNLRYTKKVVKTKVARLNNQIFRPDVWYAPPPRCNVIFPELYNNIQWSRNFMREVSRLELQSTNAILGDNALFNGRYYSPNVPDMRKGAKLSQRAFSQMIMEHELYTGIIPMYEKMTELNLFGMQATGNDRLLHLKVGYGQRAANHQYFKHRFASRQMQCTGRFNPWAVAGFPTLIIDRPLNAEQLTEAAKAENPTDLQKIVAPQFVGTLVQLSHSVSQQGGQTTYAFAQARVHRESAEYLGVDNVYVSKIVGSAVRTSVIFCRLTAVPKIGDVGPMGGTVTKTPENVTNQYVGKTKKVYPENKVPYKMVRPQAKPVQQSQELNMSVPEQRTTSKIPTWEEAVHAFKVTEKIVRREKRALDNIPIEDAIRPPWIWTGWHNKKIGDTYYKMIGTTSIVDVGASIPEEGSPVEQEAIEPDAVVYSPTDHVFEEQTGFVSTDAPKPVIDTPVIKKVVTDPSMTVEVSTDNLVKIYSTVREQGLDVGNFIRLYTWRPIANMADILGTPDLTYKEESDGHVVVATGREGFHSRAFSDQDNLFGLANPTVRKILGIKTTDDRATYAKLDVRSERRAVVRSYVFELNHSRGLLG